MDDLHQNHRARLRGRFTAEGLGSFADHNKLELLLFYAIPRVDTNEIAHRLLAHFGSLAGVFDAPFDELKKVPGIGEAAATLIKLIPAFSAAYLADQSAELEVIDTAEKAAVHLIPQFIGLTNEVMLLVCLDAQSRIIATRQVAEGIQMTVAIALRRIVEICMQTGAISVIVAHNHPRGKPLPSRADFLTSGRITSALGPIGITVADHMIFAGKEYVSLGKCTAFFAPPDAL